MDLDHRARGRCERRIASGDIKPLVAQTFALDQIREAQTQFETKAHIGKLVIDINSVR